MTRSGSTSKLTGAAAPEFGLPGHAAARLRKARVLIAGLGNIGSFLVLLLAPVVAGLRLVDRGRVADRHYSNQAYGASAVGQYKVDAAADRLRQEQPQVAVESYPLDLESLPMGVVDGVDLCLAGLDSLRARQLLISDRAYRLGIPVIDGAVGDPLLGMVRVYLPGDACLECSWSAGHYRTVATEFPCFGPPASTGTVSPALLGSAVASLMAAEAVRLLTGNAPATSRELACNLLKGRFLTSRLHRAASCRYCRHIHRVTAARIDLPVAFAQATVADLLAAVGPQFGADPVQFEFPRFRLSRGPFSECRFLNSAALRPYGRRRLADVGLSPADYVHVRSSDSAESVFVICDRSPLHQERPA